LFRLFAKTVLGFVFHDQFDFTKAGGLTGGRSMLRYASS
jgi:hypothetical protein